MTDREYILKLVYVAFLDIRAASHSQDMDTCFVLLDIFHNVPLRVNLADKGEMDYAEIVAWIRKKCEESNYTSWLDKATAYTERLL